MSDTKGSVDPVRVTGRARAWLDAPDTGRAERWVVAALAAAGAVALWWATGPRGLGVTNDGVEYLSTAENILDGRGFGSWLQMPLTTWPLGYPTLLAALAKVTTVPVLTAARLVAVAVALGITWTTWRLTARVVDRRVLRLASVGAVAFAAATTGVLDKVLSDGVAALATLMLILALLRVVDRDAVDRGAIGWLVGSVAIAWVAFLVRYAGVASIVVGAGILLLFPVERPVASRLRWAAGYAGGALLVPLGYLLRNRATTSASLGFGGSGEPGVAGLKGFPSTVADWVVGRPAPDLFVVIGAMLILALGATAVVLASRARLHDDGRRLESLRVLGCYWLGLVVFMAVLRLVVFYDVDGRTLTLFYPLTLVFIAGLLGRIRSPRAATVVTAVFVGWSVLVSVLGVRALAELRWRGSGYHDRVYDPTYAELRAADVRELVPRDCDLRTNQPNLLYLAGLEAGFTPRVGVADPAPTAAGPCVVWFDRAPPEADTFVPLDELVRAWHLTPTYQGDTFTVYAPGGRAPG